MTEEEPRRRRSQSLDDCELPPLEMKNQGEKTEPEPRRRKKPSRRRSCDGLEHMKTSTGTSTSKKKTSKRGITKSQSSDGLELMRNSIQHKTSTATSSFDKLTVNDSQLSHSQRPSSRRRGGLRKTKSSDGLEHMKPTATAKAATPDTDTAITKHKKRRGVSKSTSMDGIEQMKRVSKQDKLASSAASSSSPSPPKKRGIRKSKSSDGLDFVKTTTTTTTTDSSSTRKRSKPKRSKSSDGLETMKSLRASQLAKQQQQQQLLPNQLQGGDANKNAVPSSPLQKANSSGNVDHMEDIFQEEGGGTKDFPPYHLRDSVNKTPADEDEPEKFDNEPVNQTMNVAPAIMAVPATVAPATVAPATVAPAPTQSLPPDCSPSLQVKFADGIQETRHADGSIKVHQPNGRVEHWKTNGVLEIRHPDGSVEHQQHNLVLYPSEMAPIDGKDDLPPTCCGLQRKWFLMALVIVLMVIIGGIVGVVVALGGGGSSSDDESASNLRGGGTSAPVAPIAPTSPDGDIFVAPTVSPTTSAPTGPTTDLPTLSPTQITCPEQHCPNAVVTTVPPISASESSGCSLSIDAIDTHVYADTGDVLIEYLGPANPSDAAAMVITASHGGYLEPTYIPDRTANNPLYCVETTCRVNSDSFTRELALEIAQGFIRNYCKVPYIVLNNLHRVKLDANREIAEAAHGDPTAESAWLFYHTSIAAAQQRIVNEFGTESNSQGIEGVRGMLLDVHGYTGFDWDTDNGSPFIQWGFNINEESMNPNNYCPIDTRTQGRMGTFSFGRFLPNQSYECLIRGPQSLGTRVSSLYSDTDWPMCASGLPSFEHPNPTGATLNTDFCNDFRTNGQACNYFEGGDTVRIHEYLNWTQADAESTMTDPGILMNTVQAEFPRCLTWATPETQPTVHTEIANAISIGFCSFMKDLFPGAATCGQ